MIPPRSPYSLIQEDLWPDRFKILVACMLLNLTARRQAEKVIPRLFRKYPTPESLAEADQAELSEIIAPLGLRNRRSKGLIAMAQRYIRGGWTTPRELPGVGEYAAAAWEIFVDGRLPDQCPKDGALTKYYHWRVTSSVPPRGTS